MCGCNENPDLSVRKLAEKLGFPASSVHNFLKSSDTRLATARKAGSGTKTDLRNHQKDAMVHRHRQGMKSFKVKTVPNRKGKQNVTARSRARKLYHEYLTMRDNGR